MKKIALFFVLFAAIALRAQTTVTAPGQPVSMHYASSPYLIASSDSVILMSGGFIVLPAMTARQTLIIFNTNASANLTIVASGGNADSYLIPPGGGVVVTNHGKRFRGGYFLDWNVFELLSRDPPKGRVPSMMF